VAGARRVGLGGGSMALTYFKRFRMEIDVAGRVLVPPPPQGYRFVPWDRSLLGAHAEVKYRSFRHEIDAAVFPCFCDLSGCYRLMEEIVYRKDFLPECTWLAARVDAGGQVQEYCGTVQGVREHGRLGAVQNLGIAPEHRGRSIGTGLLLRALQGFRKQGLRRVYLEVTADNFGAVRLYRRLGFKVVKTTYRAVEAAVS